MPRENHRTKDDLEKAKKAIIGNAYRELISLVEKYAQQNFPVLFVGKTGTGKELFARLYFAVSRRAGKKKSVNCAQFRGDLLNSEVFGHVKGAFTGAIGDRKGKLQDCSKGILFLDELGASTPEFQTAILRVSDGYPFSPVGSEEEIEADTLLIAATNSPQQIREDLKYRFHTLPVPPLQKSDIPALSRHFLGKTLKPKILDRLISKRFPGNIRDLKRECEKLKAERGEEIFDKRGSVKDTSFVHFDYPRYSWELDTWNKYLLPIIQKYDLGFQFEFFPLPETPHESGDLIIAEGQMQEAIRGLIAGEKDDQLLQKFTNGLKLFSAKRNLNRLLKNIDLFLGLVPPEPKIEKPDLGFLLDLEPLEALREFELNYLNYHLGRHSQNIRKTAISLKMNPETLRTRLRRLGFKK